MSFEEIETWEVKLPGLAMFVLGKKYLFSRNYLTLSKRIGLDIL